MSPRRFIWFIAGLAIGVFIMGLFAQPSTIFTFICGTIASYIIRQIFMPEMDATQKWLLSHPVPARYWRHAKLFARGHHTKLDPRDCKECDI